MKPNTLTLYRTTVIVLLAALVAGRPASAQQVTVQLGFVGSTSTQPTSAGGTARVTVNSNTPGPLTLTPGVSQVTLFYVTSFEVFGGDPQLGSVNTFIPTGTMSVTLDGQTLSQSLSPLTETFIVEGFPYEPPQARTFRGTYPSASTYNFAFGDGRIVTLSVPAQSIFSPQSDLGTVPRGVTVTFGVAPEPGGLALCLPVVGLLLFRRPARRLQ